MKQVYESADRATPRDAAVLRKNARDNYARKKLLVFKHYGMSCRRCGIDDLDVLTIDHDNNKGSDHRRNIGASQTYGWLIKNNFPTGYTTLCFNCNVKKHLETIRNNYR